MLINQEKIRQDSGIKVVLKSECFDMFIQNIDEYFRILKDEFNKTPPKITPFEALNIISLLAGCKDYFKSLQEWERLTLESLKILRKGIVSGVFNNFSAFLGMTHVAFVIHNLSLKTPSIMPFWNGVNKALLDNLNSYLNSASKEDLMNSGNFEVIAGLSGPLRYLLDFSENDEMADMVAKIVDLFIKRSKEKTVAGYKVIGWHYYTLEVETSYLPFKAPNGVVNYGVSHGMAGPLVTLSLAYKNGVRRDGLEEAINSLISEYMETFYYVNDIVYWPRLIKLEQRVGLEKIDNDASQMSWCYGSVGILRALYMAGEFTSNTKLMQFATKEFNKITMMDMSNYLLTQPIVCHGHSGTAAVVNTMYLSTGTSDFLRKAVEMVEVCTLFSVKQFIEHQNEINKNISSRRNAQLHEYLEGYSGILQSIFSIIKGEPNENERRLLIV